MFECPPTLPARRQGREAFCFPAQPVPGDLQESIRRPCASSSEPLPDEPDPAPVDDGRKCADGGRSPPYLRGFAPVCRRREASVVARLLREGSNNCLLYP